MKLKIILKFAWVTWVHSVNVRVFLPNKESVDIDSSQVTPTLPILRHGPPHDGHPIPISNKGDLKTAKDFAVYSGSIYCDADRIRSWSCPDCKNHPKLKLGNLKIIENREQKLFGAVGTNQGRIVVAIKGTDNIKNTIQDQKMMQDDYQLNNGKVTRLHKGWNEDSDAIFDDVYDHVKYLTTKYPDYPVYITGLSLGGAVAVLIAVKLEASGVIEWPNTHLYTFGQPRVGDQVLADFLNSRKGATFLRVNTMYDPIPNLPFRFLGYTHHQYIALLKDGKLQDCDEYFEDPNCYGFINTLNFPQHITIMGTVIDNSCFSLFSKSAVDPMKPLAPLMKAIGI